MAVDTNHLWPTADLSLVSMACEANQPLEADDTRYANFDDLRRSEGLKQIKNKLLQNIGRCHHLCLSGHRGSGKSTELKKLEQWANTEGFLAVHTEIDTSDNRTPLELSDLLFLMAGSVEKRMDEIGHPLPRKLKEKVVGWFHEVIREDVQKTKSELSVETEAQLGGSTPFNILSLIAKFKAGVKSSSSHSLKVQERIRNYPGDLVTLTNALIDHAREVIAANGRPKGLLIIVDDLDKYPKDVINQVLFDGGDLIRQMKAHAVFSIPISLAYTLLFGPRHDVYGHPTVLPMLALRKRSTDWAHTVAETSFDNAAVASMRDALNKRIQIDALFENPTDADLLIKMSGGCIRDLMHLVTELANRREENAAKITSATVNLAIRIQRRNFARPLGADNFANLAAIAHRTDQLTQDEISLLLSNRHALLYLDEEEQEWRDVHPLIIETVEFQNAYRSSTA